ncbi:unnamed protein product [Macrosiphum euphorbiae]|nr:unnamed protein product [Macrosiphum euphorbiae]
MIFNSVPYKSNWNTFKIVKIWASSDDFIRAKQKLKLAIELSETEDINSEYDEKLSKNKRRILAAKRAKHKRISPVKNIQQTTPKKTTISHSLSNYPLPKHPFSKSLADDDDQFVQHDKDNAVPVWSMLDSSNYKTSSDKKSYSSLSLSKTLKKSPLKQSMGGDHQTNNHIAKSASKSPIKSKKIDVDNIICINNSPLHSAYKSPIKSKTMDIEKISFNNSPLHSDTKGPIKSKMIDVDNISIDNSPLHNQILSMPLSPFIISTDLKTPNTKTISIKKKLFSSQSPAKQKSKDKEQSLQYTVNIVTELSIKVNKILLNLSRQEEMLKNILHKVHFNNENDETINGDDAILEGFPIDNLDCLKDINNKLAIDKMFCKQLMKMLKEFRGYSVSKVTKSIMDTIFTNNLGRQISLTGKGPMNKKEKEPLKSSMIFKVITGVILKNVKDSNVSTINKAVSGWLKHSKERYQRDVHNNNHVNT